MEAAAARFARYCRPGPGGCLLYTGALNWGGYGKFWFEGRTVSAHRFAYESAYGPVPDGLTIDHLCCVRHCVEPTHLEAVSIQENLRRAPGRPEQRTHCLAGHPYSGHNLSLVTNRGRVERRCKACMTAKARARKAAAG